MLPNHVPEYKWQDISKLCDRLFCSDIRMIPDLQGLIQKINTLPMSSQFKLETIIQRVYQQRLYIPSLTTNLPTQNQSCITDKWSQLWWNRDIWNWNIADDNPLDLMLDSLWFDKQEKMLFYKYGDFSRYCPQTLCNNYHNPFVPTTDLFQTTWWVLVQTRYCKKLCSSREEMTFSEMGKNIIFIIPIIYEDEQLKCYLPEDFRFQNYNYLTIEYFQNASVVVPTLDVQMYDYKIPLFFPWVNLSDEQKENIRIDLKNILNIFAKKCLWTTNESFFIKIDWQGDAHVFIGRFDTLRKTDEEISKDLIEKNISDFMKNLDYMLDINHWPHRDDINIPIDTILIWTQTSHTWSNYMINLENIFEILDDSNQQKKGIPWSANDDPLSRWKIQANNLVSILSEHDIFKKNGIGIDEQTISLASSNTIKELHHILWEAAKKAYRYDMFQKIYQNMSLPYWEDKNQKAFDSLFKHYYHSQKQLSIYEEKIKAIIQYVYTNRNKKYSEIIWQNSDQTQTLYQIDSVSFEAKKAYLITQFQVLNFSSSEIEQFVTTLIMQWRCLSTID